MGMMAKESDSQLDVLVEEVTESMLHFLSVLIYCPWNSRPMTCLISVTTYVTADVCLEYQASAPATNFHERLS